MTNEQINHRIAELRGRRRNPKGGWYPDNGWEFGTQGILNYCSDLNAMHEAERMLMNQFTTIEEAYWRNLQQVKPHPIYATARQRAEAFLRTLGKWEEATK